MPKKLLLYASKTSSRDKEEKLKEDNEQFIWLLDMLRCRSDVREVMTVIEPVRFELEMSSFTTCSLVGSQCTPGHEQSKVWFEMLHGWKRPGFGVDRELIRDTKMEACFLLERGRRMGVEREDREKRRKQRRKRRE